MQPEWPILFPAPRLAEWSRGGAPVDLPVQENLVSELPSQGFEIEITADEVAIRYADAAGLRYAKAVLTQIRSQSKDHLPRLRVQDWPDFPVRGYFLDISRDRVPTRATLERLIELMTLARINHFQIMIEHAFAYRDHEVVWKDASPFTPDDVRWLDKLCRENGIELVPFQQCFGHMERWLKHDDYRHRAEVPDGVKLSSGQLQPPSTLAATAENATFALKLFGELLPNFTSRRLNIGCDEPVQLGKGVSSDAVEQRGKIAVYLEHVRRIAEPLLAQGYEVILADDVLRTHPSGMRSLADGMTPMVWWYEAPKNSDQIETESDDMRDSDIFDWWKKSVPGFRAITPPIADSGRPFWVAPGTSTWLSLIGRIDNAMANLLDAAEVGLEQGACGYLVCDFGDLGHLQPPSISYGPLMYGAAVSWCHSTNRDIDVPRVLDQFVFGDRSGVLGSVFDAVGRLWKKSGYAPFNASALQMALYPQFLRTLVGNGTPTKVTDVLGQLEDAVSRLGKAAPTCSDADIIDQELRAAIRLARNGGWRLLDHVGGKAPSQRELNDDLTEAIAEQQEAWLRRSRPGGLDDSVRPLRELAAGSAV